MSAHARAYVRIGGNKEANIFYLPQKSFFCYHTIKKTLVYLFAAEYFAKLY